MIPFGEITFKTIDNGDYEDLTGEQKAEFMADYRMFAVEELIKQGIWLVVPYEQGDIWSKKVW